MHTRGQRSSGDIGDRLSYFWLQMILAFLLVRTAGSSFNLQHCRSCMCPATGCNVFHNEKTDKYWEGEGDEAIESVKTGETAVVRRNFRQRQTFSKSQESLHQICIFASYGPKISRQWSRLKIHACVTMLSWWEQLIYQLMVSDNYSRELLVSKCESREWQDGRRNWVQV